MATSRTTNDWPPRREADLVADDPGATLFHCHQALHMNYGFMRLFEYV